MEPIRGDIMRRIRINDFYEELSDDNSVEVKSTINNLNDIKRICLNNQINQIKLKYILSKLIMYLLELIDVLMIFNLILSDKNRKGLLILVIVLNIVIGIFFIITPDYKFELVKKEKELNNI